MPTDPMSDQALCAVIDEPALCISINGPARSLREALLNARAISASGRSPFPIEYNGIVVSREQMHRLWSHLSV